MAVPHFLFVTGRLAEPRLTRVLEQLGRDDFTWEVRQIGVQVAALMTPEIVRRRLGDVERADRIWLPGRMRGELAPLEAAFGRRFARGPEELKDLPEFFGRGGKPADLDRHDMRIFAEIVEAPQIGIAAILARAAELRAEGADVIDLGCLPEVPFPHLAETVQALVAEGYTVSVDSADPAELRRGAAAGASFLLSLTEDTLGLADEVAATPVLIPARHGELDGLVRACEQLARQGRPFLADPILDPIHMGFAPSIVRYHALRERLPEAEILMGVGNLTELTDADTTGITMTLLGLCSELRIRNLLVVRVSPHCRRAVVEADRARRILFAAREEGGPPQHVDPALLCLRDRKPFPNSPAEIEAAAREVRDPNFRIEVAEDGVHVYNRAGHRVATDPFAVWPELGVEDDAGHAFYLGVELARAQIAWQLGKRYSQDNALRWGCAVDLPEDDVTRHATPGSTLESARERRRRG